MRVPRIFTDQPLQPGSRVQLDARAHRYVSQVLRLRVGQHLILFNGNGSDFDATLSHCGRKGCSADVLAAVSTGRPAALQVHLGIAVSRGERMDFALQKAVELGVESLTPLFSERSVVKLGAQRLERRFSHWRGIVISACEQSGRHHLPDLRPCASLPDWLAAHQGGLMLYHRATQSLADLPPPSRSALNLLIGPEGGLSESERALAFANGFVAVRLGPRILRTETAPIAALAAIQVLWGDFR
ncbi:MAG: 16S rRNA (uracil(1498)-N(3))-methyltransferase [Sedimenticolaceae bacterium]